MTDKTPRPTLDSLWNATPPGPEAGPFSSRLLADLPEPARRYFEHAIKDGTPTATRGRIRMHGRMLAGRWLPLKAEQVIDSHQGFVWKARVGWGPLSLRGTDFYFDGAGSVNFKLFGLIPFVRAEGPDVSRSSIGRVLNESVLVPSALLPQHGVSWEAPDEDHAVATLTLGQETARLNLTLAGDGSLRDAWLMRWGNPDHGPFCYVEFGVLVEAERTFDGYTIPAQMRAGWWYGTDRFSQGEFFRATIDEAVFR